jgi:hypothetical protein
LPLLNAFWESVVIALITIVYGVRWERHYTAFISVVMNVVFTVVLFSSTDLPAQMAGILIIYIILGVITAWRTLRPVFFLFGTKTFGALALTVALASSNNLGWTMAIASQVKGIDLIATEYMVSWVIIAVLVHIIGFILFPPRPHHSPML